jgi:RNA polymerase sigma factor (sigma-70 family)
VLRRVNVEVAAEGVAAKRGARATSVADDFERLFQAEYARVVAIAQRIVADRDDAEDVAQEVFVSFHRGHAANAAYAPAWLHAAAAHAALNVLRGKRRRAHREAAEAFSEASADADPARVVEEAERGREVREALGRLGGRSATVLALRYSGLSYAEVAAALGVGIGQVGTLLRRAEAALRKEMTRGAPR